MSDRKYSDPMVYDNSIDSDDEPDGSSGGYDRHGNYIIPSAMKELVTLRQQLAELREAVHEAQEIYAGMEGFIPRNARAAYTLRVIEQMYKALLQGEKE